MEDDAGPRCSVVPHLKQGFLPNQWSILSKASHERSIAELQKLVAVFTAIPFFQNLDPDVQMQVCKALRLVRFGAGEVVFKEGAPGDEMYVILSGSVSVRVRNVSNRKAFLGRQSFLNHEPRCPSPHREHADDKSIGANAPVVTTVRVRLGSGSSIDGTSIAAETSDDATLEATCACVDASIGSAKRRSCQTTNSDPLLIEKRDATVSPRLATTRRLRRCFAQMARWRERDSNEWLMPTATGVQKEFPGLRLRKYSYKKPCASSPTCNSGTIAASDKSAPSSTHRKTSQRSSMKSQSSSSVDIESCSSINCSGSSRGHSRCASDSSLLSNLHVIGRTDSRCASNDSVVHGGNDAHHTASRLASDFSTSITPRGYQRNSSSFSVNGNHEASPVDEGLGNETRRSSNSMEKGRLPTSATPPAEPTDDGWGVKELRKSIHEAKTLVEAETETRVTDATSLRPPMSSVETTDRQTSMLGLAERLLQLDIDSSPQEEALSPVHSPMALAEANKSLSQLSIAMSFVSKIRKHKSSEKMSDHSQGEALPDSTSSVLPSKRRVDETRVLGFTSTEVAILHVGKIFGEIALHVDGPRTASVLTKTDCVLAVLSRNDYKATLQDVLEKQRQQRLEFLRHITFLENAQENTLLKLVSSMRSRHFRRNESVYEIGTPLTEVFFIYEGEFSVRCPKSSSDERKDDAVRGDGSGAAVVAGAGCGGAIGEESSSDDADGTTGGGMDQERTARLRLQRQDSLLTVLLVTEPSTLGVTTYVRGERHHRQAAVCESERGAAYSILAQDLLSCIPREQRSQLLRLAETERRFEENRLLVLRQLDVARKQRSRATCSRLRRRRESTVVERLRQRETRDGGWSIYSTRGRLRTIGNAFKCDRRHGRDECDTVVAAATINDEHDVGVAPQLVSDVVLSPCWRQEEIAIEVNAGRRRSLDLTEVLGTSLDLNTEARDRRRLQDTATAEAEEARNESLTEKKRKEMLSRCGKSPMLLKEVDWANCAPAGTPVWSRPTSPMMVASMTPFTGTRCRPRSPTQSPSRPPPEPPRRVSCIGDELRWRSESRLKHQRRVARSVGRETPFPLEANADAASCSGSPSRLGEAVGGAHSKRITPNIPDVSCSIIQANLPPFHAAPAVHHIPALVTKTRDGATSAPLPSGFALASEGEQGRATPHGVQPQADDNTVASLTVVATQQRLGDDINGGRTSNAGLAAQAKPTPTLLDQMFGGAVAVEKLDSRSTRDSTPATCLLGPPLPPLLPSTAKGPAVIALATEATIEHPIFSSQLIASVSRFEEASRASTTTPTIAGRSRKCHSPAGFSSFDGSTGCQGAWPPSNVSTKEAASIQLDKVYSAPREGVPRHGGSGGAVGEGNQGWLSKRRGRLRGGDGGCWR
eukprot:TRINITY_DN37879_c0_g1_i1.p1 TRINITY_DN37879_c0_g1~~TRINITY_DN37879_c0_g1_i1.p1  ORF type:complete len:1397 (-),score=198.30 TRINITY_DN37879_c0_g1_i1:115-4281(-)